MCWDTERIRRFVLLIRFSKVTITVTLIASVYLGSRDVCACLQTRDVFVCVGMGACVRMHLSPVFSDLARCCRSCVHAPVAQTIVEQDKKQLLRRLRRCQSLAPELDELSGSLRHPKIVELSSPSSTASDADGLRKKKGRDEGGGGARLRRGLEESTSVPATRDKGSALPDGDAPLLPHSTAAACNGAIERDTVSGLRGECPRERSSWQ